MSLRGEFWWVYLGTESPYWARRVAGEELPREEGICSGPEELPIPEGARVVLCVPGQWVRIHPVDLPARSRRKFLAAMPFALEDQLLRDPAEYHFLPLPPAPDRPETPVAVVEHARIQAWLEPFQERDWRVRLLLPDYLAIPAPREGKWLLDVSATPFLLRRSHGWGGAAVPGEVGTHPPGGLLLALEEAEARPQDLQIRISGPEEREQVSAWTQWLEPYGVGIELLEDGRSRGAWLARQPLPGGRYNLLTGPYASREDPWVLARRLAPAGGLAAALALALGAQWLLEGSRLRAEHARLEQAIVETYREAFPQATNIVDARYQMEQRLKDLRQKSAEEPRKTGLLPLLQKVAPDLSQSLPDTRLMSLGFERGALTMEVTVADYEELERVKTILDQQGKVQVQNAELKDGKVRGRLRLTEEG